MLIYLVLVLFILLGVMVHDDSKHEKNIYLLVIAVVMILIVGLRDITVGKVDTEYVYAPRIEKYFSFTYQQVWKFQSKDKVFYILTKAISNIFENVNFVIFIIGIPFIGSTVWLVKKYSRIAWLSFILFLGLSYFTMSLFLLRQVVAMAITTLAFSMIVERKPVKFIVLVLLASLFHQTALIFLLAYPIAHLSIGLKQWMVIITSFGLSILGKNTFISKIFVILNTIFSDTSRYDTYQDREGGIGYIGFFIQLAIFALVTYVYRNEQKNEKGIRFEKGKIVIRKKHSLTGGMLFNREMNIMINMAMMSLCLTAFSAVLGEMWRAASYFGIFNIILLPNALGEIENRHQKRQFTFFVALIFVLYFFLFGLENASALNYTFFFMN